MTTALDIVSDAMKLLGVLQAGETPSAVDANDALFRLNTLLDAWNSERLSCFCDQTASLAYVAGQNPYTVGTGGDFNVGRPTELIRAWARTPSGQDIQQYLLTEQEYDAIPLKTTGGTFPIAVWYNPQYPLGQLNVYPVPNAASYTQFLRFKSFLTAFATLATTVSLPPGYLDALIKNLAVDAFPYWGGNPPAWLTTEQNPASAQAAKRRIEAVNVLNQSTKLRNDAPSGRGAGFQMDRNIQTDTLNPPGIFGS